MAVDVSKRTTQIKTAALARDVRDNIAGGLDDIANDLNKYEEDLSTRQEDFENNIDTRQTNIENRETNLENTFSQEIHNAVSSNPSSAETVASRQGYDTLLKNLEAKDNKIGNLTSLNTTAKDSTVNAINEVNSSLADNANQLGKISDNYKYNSIKSYVNNVIQNDEINSNQPSSISFIGDSITNTGLVSSMDENYLNLLNSLITKTTNAGHGSGEIMALNFTDADRYGITISGTTSLGSGGCVGKSLVMTPGSKMTITTDCTYIDVLFTRTSGSGKLEFRNNGALYRTLDCSGTSANDIFSYNVDGYIKTGDTIKTIEITCINANVEVTGLLRLTTRYYTNAATFYVNRVAVSGTATPYWVDKVNEIDNVIRMGSDMKNIVVLALGTNNIYNSSTATTPQQYQDDLRTMANYFITQGHTVLLTCPPLANESIFPTTKGTRAEYDTKLYELASELKLNVVDLSKLNLINLLGDGIHPNDEGNRRMFSLYKDVFGLQSKLSTELPKSVLNTNFAYITTYANGWTYFSSANIGVRYRKKNDIVYLEGLCSSGTVTQDTIMFTLPEGFRPTINDKHILVNTNGNAGSVVIKTTGEVTARANINNTFVSFDNISFFTI